MRNQKDTQPNNGAAPATSPVLLHSIRPVNLLSFGPDTPEIPLGPLNILIGPNGSGKSNLIEIVCLLRDSANHLPATLRRSGGVTEWIWKGEANALASVEVLVAKTGKKSSLRHTIEFIAEQQAFYLTDERLRYGSASSNEVPARVVYEYASGFPMVGEEDGLRQLPRDTVKHGESILSQLRDPERYPEITFLAEQYSHIRVYREWQFGRESPLRQFQPADLRTDRLEENFTNLGLFLNHLRRDPKAKKRIQAYLHDLYVGLDDFDVSVKGGTVQVFLTEGNFTISATRLSDGTLRYLCLLAILCDPNPPPLICIEEPELGLHPDILPKIADLLVEASTRTQLIVTTHSDILVDAMTERPEAVLVCEKHEGQTQMTRLKRDDLALWLEKYRLGALWMRGELGGVRW